MSLVISTAKIEDYCMMHALFPTPPPIYDSFVLSLRNSAIWHHIHLCPKWCFLALLASLNRSYTNRSYTYIGATHRSYTSWWVEESCFIYRGGLKFMPSVGRLNICSSFTYRFNCASKIKKSSYCLLRPLKMCSL